MTRQWVRLSGLVIAVGVIGGGAALAAEMGDAVRGERLAKRWCAACHVVTPEQTRAAADAPSFAGLANDPAKTSEGLVDFLTLPETTHSKMPDLALSRVEMLDIVAHIRSLKK